LVPQGEKSSEHISLVELLWESQDTTQFWNIKKDPKTFIVRVDAPVLVDDGSLLKPGEFFLVKEAIGD
jgi:hypothetical protein